jgi:hypothetical protein
VSDREPPRLLVRERGELDAVAAPLREGRRVAAFLVGEAALRPVALAYLREASGAAIPEAEAIRDPWRMLDALTEAAALGPKEIRSIAVDHRVEEVLRTLNWHREKLRRGASVLLWLDGVEGLRALRAMAPDAYSFRDTMVFLTGEEPERAWTQSKESVLVQLARIPYEAASTPDEQAEAAMRLADAFSPQQSLEDLRELLGNALSRIPKNANEGKSLRTTRARLLRHIATEQGQDGRLIEMWRSIQAALGELADVDSSDSDILRLRALMRSPLGTRSSAASHAPDDVSPTHGQPNLWSDMLMEATKDAIVRGEARRARSLMRGATALTSSTWNCSLMELSAQVSLLSGDLSRAEEEARRSYELRIMTELTTYAPDILRATCSRLRGELQVARRIYNDILARTPDLIFPIRSANDLADLDVEEGALTRGLAGFRTVLQKSASSARDGHLYDTFASYVTCLRAAHEAARLSPRDLTDADTELAVAEDISLSLSGADPPWYSILFPGLRAEILSLRPERLDEAVTLAGAALDRARALWPDAVPLHARMHAAHLLRAGRLDQARAALAVAEPEAAAQRHLRELARLQALAVVVLVRGAASASEIDAKMASLRATLDETGAPRIAADTLLELALLLPPSSRRPDPLALLDEAHALFLEMPIVAQEARCLEAMGDVLAARGQQGDARRRYLAAKAVYARHGLGLRLPLLSAKIEGAAAAS